MARKSGDKIARSGGGAPFCATPIPIPHSASDVTGWIESHYKRLAESRVAQFSCVSLSTSGSYICRFLRTD